MTEHQSPWPVLSPRPFWVELVADVWAERDDPEWRAACDRIAREVTLGDPRASVRAALVVLYGQAKDRALTRRRGPVDSPP